MATDKKSTTIEIGKVVDNLNNIGVLYQLAVSKPSFKTKLTFKDLGLPDISGIASPASMKLIDEAKLAPFGTLQGRMRSLLNENSFEFFAGLRYVPWGSFQEVNSMIESMIAEWNQHLLSFSDEYAANQEAAVVAWREPAEKIWDSSKILQMSMSCSAYIDYVETKVRSEWPAAKELGGKFGIKVNCCQVSSGITGSGVEPAVIAEAQKLANDEIKEFIGSAMGELRKRTVELCSHVRSVMLNSGTIHENSLRPLREWIEKFKSLNFLEDQVCAEYLESLTTYVTEGSANDMQQDTDYLAAFGQVLDTAVDLGKELSDEIVSEQLQSLSGKKVRKLHIGDAA